MEENERAYDAGRKYATYNLKVIVVPNALPTHPAMNEAIYPGDNTSIDLAGLVATPPTGKDGASDPNLPTVKRAKPLALRWCSNQLLSPRRRRPYTLQLRGFSAPLSPQKVAAMCVWGCPVSRGHARTVRLLAPIPGKNCRRGRRLNLGGEVLE